jgi:hypothetical protein
MDYNCYSTWGGHHLGVLVDSTVCAIRLDFELWHRRLDIGGRFGMSDIFLFPFAGENGSVCILMGTSCRL